MLAAADKSSLTHPSLNPVPMKRFGIHRAALCQLGLAAAIIVVIALWPPQRGAMLMIPLDGRLATAVDVAMAGGAALLATGPLPGSMIVIGDRAALDRSAIGHGILLLAAPRALCGDRLPGKAV